MAIKQSTLIRRILLFVVPVFFSPLLFFGTPYRCLFAISMLSLFWICELMPIGVTSLFPLFLFPILGIESSKEISKVYFKDSIVLFMSTLIMAMAVESTNLHKRIALKLLTKVGAGKHVMLLGFMITTSFISFFVSDTACTALMVPIAVAILSTMSDAMRLATRSNHNDIHKIGDHKTIAEQLGLKNMSAEDRGFCKALIMSCAHASLIGGTAIITSTGPNIVFRENIQTRYPGDEISMSYLQWMAFALPPMILYLLSSYFTLVMVFLGPKSLFRTKSTEDKKTIEIVEKNIAIAYEELGPVTFGEYSVFGWFFVLLSSWISRRPGFAPGWGDLLNDNKFISDSVSGIMIASVMFVWPKDPFGEGGLDPILTWSDMKSRYSWSCTLLIGAGYAISDGVDKSGLSKLISCTMRRVFDNMSSLALQVTVTTTIVIMTEFASNVSTANIFIPIVLNVAESMRINPLYLALPTAVACSFSFMLPISTPPNSIVYDTRVVSAFEMIISGLVLNVLCVLVTTLNMNTWANWLFALNTFPDLPDSIRNSSLYC